jgi:hypothetical protein
MPDPNDNLWGKEIFRYTRAQAIADGILVDLTTAPDDRGQRLCQEAGFKVPVAITRSAWAKVIEAGGAWKPHGDGGQSLTGRLWDLLWMLRGACGHASNDDRVYFQVLVDVNGDGHHETVKLWALCGPGDDAAQVITVALDGED